MARRKKPTDLFDAIPRSVAQARKAARAIGVRMGAERYRAIEAAERVALDYLKRKRKKKPKRKRKPKPTVVPLTARERREQGAQRAMLAEQLAYQRLRAVRDALDAGAPPSAVILMTRDWGMSPDLWLTQSIVDDWADDLDIDDLSMRDVYDAWHDSPPGSGAWAA